MDLWSNTINAIKQSQSKITKGLQTLENILYVLIYTTIESLCTVSLFPEKAILILPVYTFSFTCCCLFPVLCLYPVLFLCLTVDRFVQNCHFLLEVSQCHFLSVAAQQWVKKHPLLRKTNKEKDQKELSGCLVLDQSYVITSLDVFKSAACDLICIISIFLHFCALLIFSRHL